MCERPARSGRALVSLSWYASVAKGLDGLDKLDHQLDLKLNSPYVIQGVSATVRGQSKLSGEGEPQGENRLAPEPSDPPSEGVDQEGQ